MNAPLRERLQSADLRFLAVCVALLAVTTWFSVRYFYRAFPEASIDFRVSRAEAADTGAKFLAGRGFDIAAYQHAARFEFDNEAKTFLEREVGLERANQILGSQVRLWRWSNRWFRPLQKQEFSVDITTKGEVAGFAHQIAEADPLPSISQQEARGQAEQFLRETVGKDAAALEFVEGSSTVRPARTDHSFTWQDRSFDVNGSKYRFDVWVLGNQIGGFHEYLKVPEQWSRSYETLRSRNEAAQTVDTALVMLLMVALLAALVIAIRRHDVRWRLATIVGATGMVLLFLSNWNEFPLHEFSYPTTDSYASFLTQNLLRNVLAALGAGTLLALLTAAAEPMYRASFGSRMSLGNLFTVRGLRTRSFLRGAVLGLTLTGIFVAYQTAFYMAAYKLGAWSPADVPYDDLLNTRFPWAFVLFGGFLPAISEEFIFRMFAIPFFRKLVRVTWIALILAGFLWGFGHAGYPQQPFWIRGVEVGIGGVALGLVMLRFGILPTLVWHYSVDAMYSALLLVRSQSMYFRLSGLASAGIMVLPVAFALFEYFRRGGFDPEAGLDNRDEVQPSSLPAEPAAEAEAAAAVTYRPLPTVLRIVAVCALVLAVIAAFASGPAFDARPQYRQPESSIQAAAARFVNEMGQNAANYRVVATPDQHWSGTDELAGKYLLEQRPLASVASMLERYRPVHHWLVRYYKPLNKEEWHISVHPETGRVLGFDHELPEDQPGADLPESEARALAAAFAARQGFNTDEMALKESTSEKRKARRDYTFVWEAKPGDTRNVNEAHYRLDITVGGDHVTGWRNFWKVPEAYERQRSQRNLVSILAIVFRIVLVGTVGVVGVWLLIDRTRRHELRWGQAVRYAVPLALLGLAGTLLSFPQIYRDYPTAIPLSTFQTTAVAGSVMGAAGLMLFGTILFALILCLRPDIRNWLTERNRARLGLDALLLAALATALAAAGPGVMTWCMSRFPALALPEVHGADAIVSAFPALTVIASAVQRTVSLLVILALVYYVVQITAHRRWLTVILGLAAVAGMLPIDVQTWGEFAFYFATGLAEAAVIVAFCVWLARDNLLAYVLAAWTISLSSVAAGLFAQHNPRLNFHGWLVAAVLLLSLAWALAPAFLRSEEAPQ